MTFKKFGIYPPRFATIEDANLWMDCYLSGEKFPPEKWIHPVILICGGKVAATNPVWRDARFEVAYIPNK